MDDALALASLYGFQGKSESRVVGVSTSKSSLNSAIFADILVRFYTGEPGPFGGAQAIGLTLGKPSPDTPLMTAVLEKTSYGRNIKTMNETADPVAVFRNSLSAQFDGNAIVFLSGPATNLAQAMDLPGVKQMIAAKVRYLVAAVGNFGGGAPDPQVTADLAAAKKLFAEWPSPIFAAGAEIGDAVKFPAASLTKEFAWAPAHPLVDAYHAADPSMSDAPAPAVAAAVYAVRPKEGYFKLSDAGAISVADDGQTKLTPGAGKHQYLIFDAEKKDALIQKMVETASTKQVPRAPRFRPPQKKQ
jgi:hypothetical protein